MPLDTGGMCEVNGAVMAAGDPTRMEGHQPSIHAGGDVGQALRAIREFNRLSIEDVAERTRVRATYVTAIEEMRLDQLPSRPFVVGYIRAIAQALGVDPDAAVNRFKADEPVLDEALPEPVGVRGDKDPRLGAIVAAAFVIIAAIVAWNVVQRIMTETAPAPSTAPAMAAEKALANTTAGPVALGAPLPAPVESTTPPPYITPGLDKAVNAEGQPLVPPSAAPPPPAPELNLPATFTPRGQVYGAPNGPIVVQALKPAFLVVRGSDGTIYFARQLAEGQAYRAPAIGGLTIDVSEPDGFQVFVSGQSKGVLPKPLTDVSMLLGIAASPRPAARPPASGAVPAKVAAAAPAAAKPTAPVASPPKPKPPAPKPAPTETPPF